MDIVGLVVAVVVWAFLLYDSYTLWSNPKAYWKKASGRAAQIRARRRGSFLGLLDGDIPSIANDPDKFISFSKIGHVIGILFMLLLTAAVLSSAK